jgi:hypothetical protein
MKSLFPILAALSVACTGLIDGQSPMQRPLGADNTNPGGGASTAGSGGSAPQTMNVPFKVRNTEPELVPFDMRLRRIASAVAVPVNHPMFDEMYKNGLKLGAYDYANGALPDGSWNANRIAAWLSALRPVCNSAEMKAKYPALPDNLPQLVRAAWGHTPTAQDTADVTDAIATAGADPALVYESTCMAVFTAAEFVYR